jgi:hypothetical protein
MRVETYVDQALTRVAAEREAVGAKRDAFEAFVRRVRDISPESVPASSTGATSAGIHRHAPATTGRGCRRVRTAFAETVRPHSVDDVDGEESLLETIRAEFTEPLAMALAPTTEASFTAEFKAMLVSEARTRRAEATALERALEREAHQLDDAGDPVETIIGWVVERNETPLTDLGFDALEARHETLADHRTRCDEIAGKRQWFLERTTGSEGEAGVPHRRLVPYLYGDFPVDHPILATVASLEETCRECQRAVRDHLVRRA